jgi:hypothetical protein
LETKLRTELDELKLKSEKEYNQEVVQFTKELDTTRTRNAKDLDELRRYNANEERKFVTNAKEANVKEMRRFVGELENEYKRGKEEFKRELTAACAKSGGVSGKERDERYKAGKARLHADAKSKEEARRRQLEVSATQELCLLQRKHMIIIHRRECELLLNEINEQKSGLTRNHHMLSNHLQAVYVLKQRHLTLLQKYDFDINYLTLYHLHFIFDFSYRKNIIFGITSNTILLF